MPNTLELLAGKGMTFNRYYVSYPLCCPSRVSLLTGRYAHNTGVKGNVQPNGGYYGFSFRAAASHNLATWLQGAGYRTIHVGKFLNGYGDEPYDNGTTVPPGWDSWHTVLNADTHHYFYGYTLNNNGQVSEPYGDSGTWEPREYTQRDPAGCPFAPEEGRPCLYETDIFNWMAREEMLATPAEQPFYLQLDYTAPHGDFRKPAGPEPAIRHYDWFKGAKLPHNRSEGFDEGNVSDKPSFIREAEHLTPNDKRTYKVYYEKALESLRSIDDGVKEVVDTLGQLHRLRNTYILFTSDNGFFYGEHRLIGGKFLAYEPATHLPFLIRGPGIKPDTSTGELASNIDIAPTILDLAGVEADKSIDGRSMVPYPARPGTAQPPPAPLRVVRADQRRGSKRGDLRHRRRRRWGAGWQRKHGRERVEGGSCVGHGARLAPGAAAQLRGNPPRPLQVHRLAGRGEGALQHQQGPERAQQHRQSAELLPDPQLPPPAAAALRELRRQGMPRSDAAAAADPDRIRTPACQAPEGNPRTRTGTGKGTARTGTRTLR